MKKSLPLKSKIPRRNDYPGGTPKQDLKIGTYDKPIYKKTWIKNPQFSAVKKFINFDKEICGIWM